MKTAVKQILEKVLRGKDSQELQAIIASLPEDSEQACSDFCDRFELGNWFYEAMILNDIDIAEILSSVQAAKCIQEDLARSEVNEMFQDLQST